MQSTAHIGLGGNLGDRIASIVLAIDRLVEQEEIVLEEISSLYETEPVGEAAPQPWFVNAVLRAGTTLGPEALLARLHEIEHSMGRKRAGKWGPRIIDLDLLLHGQRMIDGPFLNLPHPRMHLRRFVLVPMVEIDPLLTHPRIGRPMCELLDECADAHGIRRMEVDLRGRYPGGPGTAVPEDRGSVC